jgi:uncharacterized protein (TIGR03435 family)
VLIDPQGRVAGFTYPAYLTPEVMDDFLAGRPIPEMITMRDEPPDQAAAFTYFAVSRATAPVSLSWSPSSIEATGFTLRYVIETAMEDLHGVDFTDAPADVLDKEYSVNAKVPGMHGDDGAARFRALFAAGIGASFPLRISVVKRVRNVYLLKNTGKPGPGLVKSAGGNKRRSGSSRSNAFIETRNGHMADLAKLLEKWLGVPVLDETGLDGGYDFDFRTAVFDRKSVSDALTAKFGLELAEASREVEVAEVAAAK